MSEYTQLVGQHDNNSSGNRVIEGQGAAEGFSRVSRFWFPQTISYEDAMANLEKERLNRRDIVSPWEEWTFVQEAKSLRLMNGEGTVFVPTEHALMQAIKYCSVSQTHVKQTLDSKFDADDNDIGQLVDLLNYRKQRHDKTNKAEERNLIFRTYADNTLRAVLTTQYAPIDNVWLLGVMNDLIPGGRISHQRGDNDTIYANILLPDNVRNEKDSDYGGMFSIRNSEIGMASLDCKPSLFRAICMNGCIHQETKGVSLRQVHKGKIELSELAVAIKENLDGQIKLIPSLMDNFLALRSFEFKKDVSILNVMAQLSLDSGMNQPQAEAFINEWNEKEHQNRTAFGVLNAITRMSQKFDPSTGNRFDIFAGSLVGTDWNVIVSKAKTLLRDDITKALFLKAA